MTSGILQNIEEYSKDKNYMIYNYKQENVISNYLVSLAVGNIIQKNITINISVFSEPRFINEASNMLKDDLPKVLQLAIDYMGPYEWKLYNVLV